MLACWSLPRRFASLSFSVTCPPYFFSTSTSTPRLSADAPHISSSVTASSSRQADATQDSIFTTPESPWEHIFSDIEPEPPIPLPAQRVRARSNDGSYSSPSSLSGRPSGPDQHVGLIQRSSGVKRRRASLTAREMSVFDEMFDLIFNAVAARDGKAGASSSSARTDSLVSSQTPSIGRSGAPLNDLFRTLRRHASHVRWTTAIDEELDRKKETMELFNTDHELLQWVTQELFGELQHWNEEAQRAIAASGAAKAKGKAASTGSAALPEDASAASSTSSVSSSTSPKEYPGNHTIYPHLIAHAMRIFRTTYSNPSLSLAIFNHAAHISIPSYVFGCTGPAYNELIEAKWEGWGDLEGVCNALEEMRSNGVKVDGRTRIVVDKVRREVGEARPIGMGLEPEGDDNLDGKDVNPFARRVWGELGETEVIRLLHRIEQLALRDRSRKSTRSSPHEEPWKSAVLQPVRDDGWSFDGWDREKGGDFMQRRKGRFASLGNLASQRRNDRSALDMAEGEMAFR